MTRASIGTNHARMVGVAVVTSLMLFAPRARGDAEGAVSVLIGGSYAYQHEKGGSGTEHGGGFVLDVAGTLWMGEYVGLTWDMLQMEGSFNRFLRWFHLGGDVGVTLHLKYFHAFTGAGAFMSWQSVKKGGNTDFRVPLGVGFRWPVEVGFHFWRMGVYGGLNFDFIAAKQRVSSTALLGDETSAYAGMTLSFAEKGFSMNLRWSMRMLDDDVQAHVVMLMFDLMPALRRGSDSGGWEPSETEPEQDEVVAAEPAPPPPDERGELEKSLDEFLDAMDRLDDTADLERLAMAVSHAGFSDFFDELELEGVPVRLKAPGVLDRAVDSVFTEDSCEKVREFNSKDVVLAYCYKPSDDKAIIGEQLETFWDEAYESLTEQYGAPSSEQGTEMEASDFIEGLFETHGTGEQAVVFSTRTDESPWVTLQVGIQEWIDGQDAAFHACIYYTPQSGSCQPPPGGAIEYEDIAIPVSAPWHSPGCDPDTSCSVDELQHDILGDFLEPWKCDSDEVLAGMLDGDAEFLGVDDLPYTTTTWSYLGEPSEVRVYEDAQVGKSYLLVTQRYQKTCYSAVFQYHTSCTGCIDEIRELVGAVTAGGRQSDAPVTFHGLALPQSPSLHVSCPEGGGHCSMFIEDYALQMDLHAPSVCADADQAEQVRLALTGDLEVLTGDASPDEETWSFIDSPASAYVSVLGDNTHASVFSHQESQCFTATASWPTDCKACPQLFLKTLVSIERASP